MAPLPVVAYDNKSFDGEEKVVIGDLHPRARRDSSVSHWPRASFVAAKNDLDGASDATSFYYNESAPEQGFSQAAADGLKRVPSLLCGNRPNSASTFEDGSAPSAEIHSKHASLDLPFTPPTSPTSSAPPEQIVVEDNISRKLQIFLLTVFCTTNLCLAMCCSLIAPFFPSEMLRKGGTATLAGIVMSSYDFIRTFLAPVFGLYVYAIGPRFMLVTGPFIGACCTVLFGLLQKVPPNVALFTALAICVRMVNGVGAIAYVVVSISIRPVLFARYLSFAFGIIQASWTTGIIVGPAVGSVLYSLGGYGLPFFVIGAVALSLSAIQFLAVPNLSKLEASAAKHKQEDGPLPVTPGPTSISALGIDGNSVEPNTPSDYTDTPAFQKPTFVAFCRNPNILFALVTFASFGFALTFYSANLALHILPLLGDNPDSKAGYIILIAGVTEVLVAPFSGLSLDYGVPPELAIAVGYAFNVVGLALIGPSPILMFLSTKLWLVIVGSAIFGCGMGYSMAAPYKLATRYVLEAGFPQNQQTFGLLAGLFASALTFGGFLGPISGGALHDLVGFPWASTIVCGYLLFILTLVIIVSTWKRLQAMISRTPRKYIISSN